MKKTKLNKKRVGIAVLRGIGFFVGVYFFIWIIRKLVELGSTNLTQATASNVPTVYYSGSSGGTTAVQELYEGASDPTGTPPSGAKQYTNTTTGQRFGVVGNAWVALPNPGVATASIIETKTATVLGQTAFTLTQIPVGFDVSKARVKFGEQYNLPYLIINEEFTIVGTTLTITMAYPSLEIGDEVIVEYY